MNDDNVMDMDITNANACAVKILHPSALQSPLIEQASEYYNLDGMRLNRKALPKGIVIKRTADGKTRKVISR